MFCSFVINFLAEAGGAQIVQKTVSLRYWTAYLHYEMGICEIDTVPYKLSAVYVFVCEFCLLEFLFATHTHTY